MPLQTLPQAENASSFSAARIVGNQTLNVGVLSYAGQLNLTAVADGDACPDIEVFAKSVQHALEKLARSVETAA